MQVCDNDKFKIRKNLRTKNNSKTYVFIIQKTDYFNTVCS